jgi:hypothetical protein
MAAEIIEAIGFDVMLSPASELQLRQRVVVLFHSEIAAFEVAIPGVVHWLNTRQNPCEAGIAVEEPIPVELELRQPGCIRTNLRFSCRVRGQLSWAGGGQDAIRETDAVSINAVATNYSREGFCVQLHSEPNIGAHVLFEWQNDRTKYGLQGVVRWVIGQGQGSLAGIELIDSRGYLLGGGIDVY